MPRRGSDLFSKQHLMMADLPSSCLLPTCEDDATAETDEPPDHNRRQSHSDGEFCKVAIQKPIAQQSLLTQALTSPQLRPMDRGRGSFSHSFSGTSFWSLSGASTAELTSDGGLSSRSHSPSPPSSPRMLPQIGRLFTVHSQSMLNGGKYTGPVQVVDEDEIEGLGRKRCIRFACNAEPNSRRPSMEDTTLPSKSEYASEDKASKSSLRFACEELVRNDLQRAPSSIRSIRFAANTNNLENKIQQTPVNASSTASSAFPIQKAAACPNPATRFHEFASSCEETESWMVQVPDRARLLRVDGVLEKEKDIRKLSEEVEAETKLEEEEEAELDAIDEEEEEDEDEDEEEDEEEDEDDYEFDDQEAEEDDEEVEEDEEEANYNDEKAEEYLSGNESDNEEGFASDSDDDSDCSFFDYPRRPINYPSFLPTPLCCRTSSTSSVEPSKHSCVQHPSSIKLPDSTDFVCGTFDEDKVLEDAYASALEVQKRAKNGITPQDIDPSFPVAESDEDDYYVKSLGSHEHVPIRGRMSFTDEETLKTRKPRSILATERPCPEGKIRFHSPAPRPLHSPAPKRRLVSPPPRGHRTPPLSRRGSNEHSDRPTISRRGSRCLSPPPPSRNAAFLNFSRPGVERTKSLPKTTKMPMHRGRFSDVEPEHASPEPTSRRIRGAIDIVKGLEKKRERRRNHLARQRPSYTRKGEGVEKMRELGLMLGKGKQAQWMISV